MSGISINARVPSASRLGVVEMQPLISLIVCTHNRVGLLPRALDSALAQQGVRLEVIVVDDCSSDGTDQMLTRKYGNKIKLIRLEENKRVAHATNKGFAASRGDYIALLGDDDYWVDPCKLQKQLSMFSESDGTLGVVGTWWCERGSSGQEVRRQPAEPGDWKDRLLRAGGIICGSTPLILRTAWVDAGGVDERIPRGTDSDLFRRIVLSGYSARILKEQTTIVDVGHGLSRMTSARGWAAARRHVFAQTYVLWKYRWYFLRFPRALLARLRALLLAPLRALM